MSATNANTQSATTSSFVSALVVAGITVGAFSGVWLIMHGRSSLTRVFQPRVELAPAAKRPPALPSGLFAFWKTVWSTPDAEVIVANGPDAYFFVRFLKVFGVFLLLPYFILTFVICIPLSAAAPTAGLTGLNILTFGNVAATMQNRHVGHFLVAIILMSWTAFLCYREYNHFVDVRQAWLSSPQHLSLARTRTVAITNLPDNINSESGIKEIAGSVARLTGGNPTVPAAPRISTATEGTAVNGAVVNENNVDADGGVRDVWLSRKIKDLEKAWGKRNDECSRLEGGVAKLLKGAAKNQRKGKTPEKQGELAMDSCIPSAN